MKLLTTVISHLYYIWLIYRTDEGVYKHPTGYLLSYQHRGDELLYLVITQKTLTYRYRGKETVTENIEGSWLYSKLWSYVHARFSNAALVVVDLDTWL